MFKMHLRAKVIHIVLVVTVLFSGVMPSTALAKPSVIQKDLANSSDDANALQVSTVLLACDPGSFTFPAFGPVCSGASPGTSLTEEFDVSGRIPYLGGGDVKFKIQCEGVGCVPQDIYYAASMDVTFSDPWGTPHDWDASLTNDIHFTTTTSEGISTTKCGVNVASGECHLEISGVIPAEIISENPDDWNDHYFTIHAYVSSPLSWVDYDIHTVVQVSLSPIVDPPTDDCPGVTLSPIAQAVLAEVEDQHQGYCGNNYDDLITLPPGQDAFERFSNFAENIVLEPGPHEIDFATMGWSRAEDDDPNTVNNDSPGEIFLRGVKTLYDAVHDNPTAYQGGVKVRILLGLKYYSLTDCQDQRLFVMDDLDRLGIEREDTNWNVEVAVYREANQQQECGWAEISGTHSHVKMMIVDGKHTITGGYNMDYIYLSPIPYHDMGVQISGPVAQHSLQVFDNLWKEAYRCDQATANFDNCIVESSTGTTVDHDPVIQIPVIEGSDVVFSLFRDHNDKTADDAIAAAIRSANSEINIIQNRFVYSKHNWYPLEYGRAILDALQKEDTVNVNILASSGLSPIDLSLNVNGMCNLYVQLFNEAPLRLLNLNFRLSSITNPIHTKALSIDNEFLIVGSQNFDPSAWGSGILTFGDLAEYSLGIDNEQAANGFQAEFENVWGDSYKSSPLLCADNILEDLEDRIEVAVPGSFVFVPSGVYTESITINKPLTLIGAGAHETIMHPEGNQPAFRITSSDVLIFNMKISSGDGYGIELIDSSPSSLENIQINRVVFENNAQGGVLAQGLISGSPMNYTIENNTFIGGADGITINMLETQAEASVIRNNIFSSQSNAPIHVLSSDDSRVKYSYNLFDDCGLGNCDTNWLQGNLSIVSSAHDNLFDLDPLFANPANGAYQLSASSPAIDAGDPELFHDFFYDGDDDGFVRIDIGAFEYAPVENVSPVVDAGVDQTVELDTPVSVTAVYIDADNSENHSARIHWGDGVIEDVPVTMTGPGAGEVAGEHTYSNMGNYTVEVCVTDLYGAVGCDTANVVVNSFPSTLVLDTFNRANGAIGSNWSGNKSKYAINANQLKVISNNSNSDIYWNSEAFEADQEAYVTFADVSTTATEQDLLLKSQSATTWGDGVLEVLYDAVGQRVQVWTYEWPAGWVQYGADIPVTFNDGDQFGARAYADGTVEVYKNGTQLATRDVSSWSYYDQGGYIGLWFIDAQNVRLDDFGGGTLSSGMQSMMASGNESASTITPEQLDVIVKEASVFWQGIPLEPNQTATLTFADVKSTSQRPQSNGVWGDDTIQLVYDLPNQRIQVWRYDTLKGWLQIGKEVPMKFVSGDTFTVRVLANGTVELYKNGKLLATRVIPQ